ncbi:PRTRC system protein C [Pedobacter nutrimenti]|uniref:PRTRC system protein C n=1 Tax=Pedobacter nutrimenti TaxID=1241337 RepID=UPI002930AA29|nr:PRTRC system protein C [Pedobacter nutrimenti]
MLLATTLPRVFLFEHKGEQLNLSDPSPDFDKDSVRDFYAMTYPILTTAFVEGPEIMDDSIQYKFVSTIGTKG